MTGRIQRLFAKLNRHQWGLWELRTLWIDWRLGGHVGGRTRTKYADVGAADVHNCPYRIIRDAMAAVEIAEDDVLVDVGCGLGRVINWWLHLGLTNRIIGIELDPDVARRIQGRLSRFSNVTIKCGNALEVMPAEATVCFLFNPFGRSVVQRWHDLMVSKVGMRRLIVIYVNCQHLEVFRASGCWQIEMLRKHPDDYCEIAILKLLIE